MKTLSDVESCFLFLSFLSDQESMSSGETDICRLVTHVREEGMKKASATGKKKRYFAVWHKVSPCDICPAPSNKGKSPETKEVELSAWESCMCKMSYPPRLLIIYWITCLLVFRPSSLHEFPGCFILLFASVCFLLERRHKSLHHVLTCRKTAPKLSS